MNFFRRFRITYLGMGPILAAALMTVAVLDAIWSSIRGTEVYPDIVASAAAWSDTFKSKDFIVVKLAVLLVSVITILIALLCNWISASRDELRKSLNELLLISLIPAAWRLAVACSLPVDHFPPLQHLGGFPLVAVIALALMARFRATIRADQILLIGGGILISYLLSIFAGLAVPASVSRLLPGTVPHLQPFVSDFAGFGIGITACCVLAHWIASKTADDFERRVLLVLKCVQFPLPLLFFYMIPPQLVDAQNRFENPYPTALVITLLVGCLASWAFMYRRLFSKSGIAVAGYPLSRAMAPAAVAAIVMFVYCGTASIPIAFRDYFHWGEQTVPWQQWYDFGKRPYVDYVPVHGLMPLMRGFFSQVFFDGTMASYSCSDILLTGCAAVALGLAASMIVSPLGALFLLLGTLPYLDRMYFLAPSLFLVASPSLLRKPTRLICLWILVCVLMVAYNPTIGPAFAVGTIPFGLWLAYRLCRENPIGLAIIALILAALGIAGWENLACREFATQFFHFLMDNAWTNEIAHGLSWDQQFNQRPLKYGTSSSQFMFETLRCGWALVGLVAVCFFWQEFRREPGARRTSLLVLAGCSPLVMLLTVPWILGRTDSSFGRSGSLANLSIFTLLPVMVMLYTSREYLVRNLLLTAMVVGFLYPSNPACFDYATFAQQTVITRQIPQDLAVVDGKDIDIPRLGRVLKPDKDDDFVSQIVELKKFMGKYLSPGATFLDMTNQTALYYYLNLPCPVRYPSFVAANSRLQSGELQQLKDHPVDVVLIGPNGWLDNVPSSLRCYELYREYALKFYPVQFGQWSILVNPKLLENHAPFGGDYHLAVLDNEFRRDNLLRLPVSWGQSWKNMSYRFEHVASIDPKKITFHSDIQIMPNGSYKPTGPSPYWEYLIPGEVKDGATADFVRIAFDSEPSDRNAYKLAIREEPRVSPVYAEPAMACYWVGEDGKYSRPIQFKARPGNLVIPLGAYPRWLLGKSPMTFRLDLQNPRCVKWFRVTEIEFLHLKTL